MATKKAKPQAISVQPICQVAAFNASLLVMLMDAARAGLWSGAAAGDSDRTSAVAGTDAFNQDHVGWVPLGKADGSEGVSIFLSLDDDTGTADLYRLAPDRLALCGPGHTQLEADGPLPEERFQGNLAPDLAGAGARWSAAQLRLRMVDASRYNPETIMPAYYKTEGLQRVPAGLRGKTVLSAQQIEDVVAYLQTLREQP